MPENPQLGLHRNALGGVVCIGRGGPSNCMSVNDFLFGNTPLCFGSGQSNNIFTETEVGIRDENFDPVKDPELWPKQFYRPGQILRIPKVVIFSAFITWMEFWDYCSFDFPHDVIGLIFSTGVITNYYYFDQWDCDGDWRGIVDPDPYVPAPPHGNAVDTDPGMGKKEFRYSHAVNSGGSFQSAWYPQWLDFYEQARNAKKTLEALEEPIYVIIGHWDVIDEIFEKERGHSIPTRNTWTLWMNNDAYSQDGTGEAHPNVLAGIGDCDIFIPDGHRARTHPDQSCPNWRSECDNPPTVPALLCPEPLIGADVLHIWVGHFCINHGDPEAIAFETYPQCPGGAMLGTVFSGTYLGAPIDFYDGRRNAWRDIGFNYGYMKDNDGTGNVKGLYNYYRTQISAAANTYKQNFWKYRNFGVRIYNWQKNQWNFNWNASAIKKDQKWCAAQQFYFGFTLAEFEARVTGEDSYFVDYSDSQPAHLKFGNTVGRSPDSPTIRLGVNNAIQYLQPRVEAYYNGVDEGTTKFWNKVINDNELGPYNVSYAGEWPVELAQVAIDYFAGKEEED